MNLIKLSKSILCPGVASIALVLTGCASTDDGSSKTPPSSSAGQGGGFARKYTADDGRTIEIGASVPANDGVSFKEPHLDKCWIANGFAFNGFDTLYIAPTLSSAKLHNAEEEMPHDLAKKNLPIELERFFHQRGMFQNIVLQETDIKPGARVLKMENTIIEYAKGGGAARYFAGLYGAGQPVLRVQGKMKDGDKTVFDYEARRSGVSGGSRMVGGFMKDVDIQSEDIRSMALDLADFMSAVSGKFRPK